MRYSPLSPQRGGGAHVGQEGVALLVMAAGIVFVVYDTLLRSHEHVHVYYNVHGGTKHAHVVVHSHPHEHVLGEGRHRHRHDYS